jgi:predicted O-methyltransferase YrrM
VSTRGPDLLGRTLQYAREHGLRSVPGAAWTRLRTFVGERIDPVPTFRALVSSALECEVLCSPLEVVRRIFTYDVREEDLARISEEYAQLQLELEERYKQAHLLSPKSWALGQSSSLLLYLIARIKKPAITLETGVGNGQSTFFLLNALLKNKRGSLYSTDTSRSAGVLLNDTEKASWTLEVIDPAHKHAAFRQVLKRLPSIDFSVHDSDHSYSWSRFEYDTVIAKMGPSSVLASDDVDRSYSFIDFAKSISIKPMILVDRSRAFGVVLLSGRA